MLDKVITEPQKTCKIYNQLSFSLLRTPTRQSDQKCWKKGDTMHVRLVSSDPDGQPMT